MTERPIIDDLGGSHAGRAAPAVDAPRLPRRRPSGRLVAIVVMAALALVAVVYAVGAVVGSADTGGGDVAPAAAPADRSGPGEHDGAAHGAGAGCAAPAGDARSGVGVIRALEHAYYVDRDGAAVRALMADGSPVAGPAETIQAGIDTVPAGTSYCLAEAQVSPTVYAVTVTEHRPGGDTVSYEQSFEVRRATDGTWVVVNISKAGGRGA